MTQQLLPATADSLARAHTPEAMALLVNAVRGRVPGIKPAEMIRAAATILDRGHGKAVQAVISVPSRVRLAAVLSGMSDESLLQIAQRGEGHPQNGGPKGGGVSEGPFNPMPEANSFGSGVSGSNPLGSGVSGPNPPKPSVSMQDADWVEAEYEEIDPLS